jgi:putative inorganic carbon (hco3(-)) transporter
MSTKPVSISISDALFGERVPWILGLLGAVLVVVFVLAHWSFAFLCGIAIVALAAFDSEPFLLGVVFLIPVSWIATISLPIGGAADRVDVPTAVRLLVVGGFFAGRLVRDPHSVVASLKEPLTKLSFLLAAVTFASLIFGGYGSTFGSLKAMVRLLSYIGFYLFLLLWVNSRNRLRKVALTVLVSAIFVTAFGIFQEIVGDYTSLWFFLNPPTDFLEPMGHRAPSFFANCNFFAGYLNLVLPFSLASWVLGEGRWKRLGAWTTGLGAVGLLCTQSLGGLVSFGGALVLAIFCFAGSWKKRLVLLATLCLLATGFYLAKGTLNPSHQGETLAYDQAIRVVLWGVAWNFFASSPLLGVGWGNFTELYGPSVTGISWIPAGQFEVHNIYLQLLAETGLVGFGVFFLLIFCAVKEAFRQLRCSVRTLEKALAFGLLGAILTVLLHGFVDFFFLVSPQYGTQFWVLLALLVVGRRTVCGLGTATPIQ